MRKKKLQLVPNPAVVSGLSSEEEARALQLADVALHNSIEATHTSPPAGSRARDDHRHLVEEIQQEAEKLLNSEPAA